MKPLSLAAREHYTDILNERVYAPVKTAAMWRVIEKTAKILAEDKALYPENYAS